MSDDPNTPPQTVVMNVEWMGYQNFDASRPGGPVAHFDGLGESGHSPVDALLGALATCAAIDVVEILSKRRTPVRSMSIEAVGQRVSEIPRRYKRITLRFQIAGLGIDREQALRAIELSVTRYCSVRSSLLAEIVVDWDVTLAA